MLRRKIISESGGDSISARAFNPLIFDSSKIDFADSETEIPDLVNRFFNWLACFWMMQVDCHGQTG